MQLIKINKKFYQVPQSWNEVTARQLVKLMDVIDQDLPKEEATIIIFKILTGATWLNLWRSGAETLEDKLHITDFIFSGAGLTKNVLPSFRGMYGPRDNFDNLVAAEFLAAESFYLATLQDSLQADVNINFLVGILYRPAKAGYNKTKNQDGDIREPFNDNLISYNSKRISGWPAAIKKAVVFWYAGCRDQLIAEFPDIFLKGGSSGGDPGKYGLWDMLYNIADKGIFGDFDKVEKQYIKTVFMAVTNILLEAERLKKVSTV